MISSGEGGTQVLLHDDTIRQIAAAHGRTAAQVIRRFEIQEGLTAIPGSFDPVHIAEGLHCPGRRSVNSWKMPSTAS